MVQTHVIVELEEGALTVTRGETNGRATKVIHCQRVPLPDLGRDTLAAVLRAVARESLQDNSGVHVIFGDRRLQHFVATLPKLPIADVNSFLVREALRLTAMPNAEEVLLAPRLVRRSKGGGLVVAAATMPRNVWDPLREAFGECGVPVLSLNSIEACLALGAETETDQPWAAIECTAGRARFVLCDGKSVVQVRRFMVGTAENDPDEFAAQLALELPRTVEWLREAGHPAPVTLVLGNRPGLDPAALDLTRGDVAVVVRTTLGSDLDAEQELPSLASAALLRELARAVDIPSLLTSPQLRLPPSRWRPVWLSAGIAAGLACSFSAVQDTRALLTLWEQLADAKTAREQLQHRAMAALADGEEPSESPADGGRLRAALDSRRPASRLLAEVCNLAAPGVSIDSLQFASAERVVLTGVVQGSTRTDALAVLAEFASRVQGLPYLASGAHEEVFEVSGQSNQFRFRLGVAWRTS